MDPFVWAPPTPDTNIISTPPTRPNANANLIAKKKTSKPPGRSNPLLIPTWAKDKVEPGKKTTAPPVKKEEPVKKAPVATSTKSSAAPANASSKTPVTSSARAPLKKSAESTPKVKEQKSDATDKTDATEEPNAEEQPIEPARPKYEF